MRDFFRILVVCSLVVLMSADAGMACRWFHARQPVWYSYAPVEWCGPYVEPSAGWQPCGEPVAGGLPVESSPEPAESVLTLPAPADDSPPPEETTVESPVPDQPAEPPSVPEVVEPLAVPTLEANSTEQAETKVEQPEPSEAADEAEAPEAEAAVSEKAEPAQDAAEPPAEAPAEATNEAEQVEDVLDDTKPAATGETEEAESETEDEDEDLFSEPSGDADKPADKAPAEADKAAAEADKEPAEKAESEDDLDSLFNDTGRSKADVQVSAGRAHQMMRRWVDNTGNYTCRGRLLQVLPGEVRVLKANGWTTTVPMRRLSQADRQFVARARRGLPPARLLAQATGKDEG